MEVTEKVRKKPMTKDEIIQELMELLKQNNMQSQSKELFELCAYVDGLEKKLDNVTEELTKVREQIKDMQEDTLLNNLKKSVSEAVERLENRCNVMKEQLFEVKTSITTTATQIVHEAKRKGKEALNRVSEFFGVRDKLVAMRKGVREAQRDAEVTIAKIDAFGKGMREAGQQMANTFRTFADKETVEYSAKEQKFSKTDLLKKPWEAKKKLFASMELHLDASIDKVENLSRDVEIGRMMKQYDTLMEESHARNNLSVVAEPERMYGDDIFEKKMEQQAVVMDVKAETVKTEPVKQSKAR